MIRSQEFASRVNDNLSKSQNEKILELQKIIEDKNEEIRKIKLQLSKYEIIGVRNLLMEYLDYNELDEDMYEITKDAIERYEKSINRKKLDKKPVFESAVKEDEPEIYKIGYCVIENNRHILYSPNEPEQEIINIPENVYFASGQFICVDKHGNYKWNYTYKIDNFENEKLVDFYGTVFFRGNEPFISRGLNEYVKVKNVPSSLKLREKQIISVDTDNNFIRYYRQGKANVDAFLDSIKAKGQSIGFVVDVNTKGYLVRDIETNNEEYIVFEPYGEPINSNYIIMYKDNKILNVIRYLRFYTSSSYYRNVSYGVVELIGSNFMVKNVLTGERIRINDIPSHLKIKNGDVVGYDEFANFVGLENGQGANSIKNAILKKDINNNS